MSNPSPQVSEQQPVPASAHPTSASESKLNKIVFQVLLGLIFLAFSALFIIILIKLPGAF